MSNGGHRANVIFDHSEANTEVRLVVPPVELDTDQAKAANGSDFTAAYLFGREVLPI